MAIDKQLPQGEGTLDVDWFSIEEASLAGEVNGGFQKSRRISGLDKMAQRWLLIFLTPRGSDIYDPSYGTDFHLVKESAVNDESYIQNLINASISDTNEALSAYQQTEGELRESEEFYTAELQDIIFSKERQSVDVYIKIVNSQGDSRILELPTPFNGDL